MEVRAELVARVWKIEKAVGTAVQAGEVLAILESMKMEIPVMAPDGGSCRRFTSRRTTA